jgi:hypothetical protein
MYVFLELESKIIFIGSYIIDSHFVIKPVKQIRNFVFKNSQAKESRNFNARNLQTRILNKVPYKLELLIIFFKYLKTVNILLYRKKKSKFS